MSMVYSLKRKPHKYPEEEQQKTFKAALAFCQIKKGIKRTDLLDKMKNCIPEYYRKLKETPDVGEPQKEDNTVQPLELRTLQGDQGSPWTRARLILATPTK